MSTIQKIRNIRVSANILLLLFPFLLLGNETTHKHIKYIPSEHTLKMVDSEYVSDVMDIPIESPEPFIAIGFNAKLYKYSDNIDIFIRVSEDAEKWSKWQYIKEEEYSEKANLKFLAALSFFEKNIRYMQFRTRNISNIKEFTFSFISPGKTPAEIIDKRIKESKINMIFRDYERPAMVLRSEWGCPQPEHVGSRPLTDVTHLIVHHSAGNTTSSDFGAVVLSYWDYHVNSHGWSDIGYNWLVDPNGVLYKGRAWRSATQENVQGAHNSGINGNTSGICFIGNYMYSSPSQAGLDKLTEILAFLCDKFTIDPLGQSYHNALNLVNDNITGHGQSGGGTLCPGTQIINRMQLLRNSTYTELHPDTSIIYPPGTPEYIKVINGNDTSLIVECDSVSQADEYIAYISTNGVTFTDSVVSSTNSIAVTGLIENTVYYFKIKAANESGSSDLSRDLYAGIPSSIPHKVLVVDGFDRGTNTIYNYVTKVAEPIRQQGYAFSHTLNETVFTGRIALTDYETVIWILGDESSVDDTFNPTEQDLIEDFLKQGGNLFVSGSEIGWDLEGKPNHATQADKDFYHFYLKASYVNDAPAGVGGSNAIYYTCEAINGTAFDGLSDFNFDDGTHGTINVDWPDAIMGINGAANILKYKNAPTDNIAGVSYSGIFPGGSAVGNLIYIALPFETIYPENRRIEVMQKVFDFYESTPNGLIDYQPEIFTLYQNYPNPFNPITTLSYTLSQRVPVTLTIYDLMGREIIQLINETQEPGYKSIQWNATDNMKYQVSAGVYLYRIKAGDIALTKKMILLK